jgi:ABC-type glycerol-3-phosphate transport system substrate-binding protein
VPAGLILDLTPWSDAYGWDESFPEASLAVLTSDEDAMTFGTGGLYAAPGALSVLGVYYNKDLVGAAGVDGPPADLAEFGDDLAAVQESGTAPLSIAGLDVGGFHIWNAILDRVGDVQDYRDWVYGVDGATIENDAAVEATDVVVDWIERGFIPESANAVGYADAVAAFTSGQAAYHVNGNWAASAIETELGDNVGFFLMPGPDADAPLVASGASVAYSISSKSENPNVAAAFLDYLGSPEAADVQFEGGFMPVNKDAEVDATGLKAEIATAFSSLVEVDGIVPFPDFAAPAMIDQLTAGIQALISKQSTSDQFLATLQGTWSEYHG